MNDPAAPCLSQVSLSFEGQINGWCFYPDRPLERAIVEIIVNGRVTSAMTAARLSQSFPEIGVGDGYCGFVASLPSAVLKDKSQAIIEIRERRFGRLIGRVVRSPEQDSTAFQKQMAAVTTQLDAVEGGADELGRYNGRNVAEHFGDLGHELMHLAHGDRQSATWRRNPGLAGAHDRIKSIPSISLGWSATPIVSLVVPSVGNVFHLAALLRNAAALLAPIATEFILLDDGSEPLAALLPTRLRHLQLIRTPTAWDEGSKLNDAALSAHGTWLAFTQPTQFDAAGLRDACLAALQPALYVDAELLPPEHCNDPELIGAQRTNVGLSCLIAREAFLTMGGFGQALGGHAMWAEFINKAVALGQPVVAWQKPRRFRAGGVSVFD